VTSPDGLPVLAFASRDDFRAWLEASHDTSDGVWLRIARKASGIPTVTYGEAVDVALCFGWIDGQRRGGDEEAFLQRFVPRRPRSRWSKVNVEKVQRLTEAGEMHPAGLAEVERAKADGRWDAAYDPPSRATVPDDLRAALDAVPAAAAAFEGLSGSNRYSILHRVEAAKRPDTRARRIAGFVDMLARGETPH